MGADVVNEDTGWEDARSVLAGTPTPGALRRRRRSRRRRVAIIALAAVLPVVVVVLLVASGTRLPGNGGSAGAGHETLELVMTFVGLGVEGVGLVLLLRGRRRPAWTSPLTALSSSQRRGLLRSVRRGVPVAEEQQDVAVDLARSLRRQRPLLLMLLGLVLTSSARAVSGGVVNVVVAMLGAVCLVVGAVLVNRDHGRAGRWLERYGRG